MGRRHHPGRAIQGRFRCGNGSGVEGQNGSVPWCVPYGLEAGQLFGDVAISCLSVSPNDLKEHQ